MSAAVPLSAASFYTSDDALPVPDAVAATSAESSDSSVADNLVSPASQSFADLVETPVVVATAEPLVADSISCSVESVSDSADLLSCSADSLSDSADSLSDSADFVSDHGCRVPYFRSQQLLFPAFAIALGGAGVKSHLLDTRSDRDRVTTIDDKLQYVPLVAYAGLGFIPGVRHEHNFGERFLAGATAYVVMTGLAQGTKHLLREPRPDTEAPNSFPSGHTATAFCGAELTRIEYGNAYGAAAYAFAVTTGVLRVVNNRHWCNDVLAGAGIGFLSAHVGYWLMPYESRLCRRIFCRGDRSSASSPFLFVPSYEYTVKAPTLSFAMTF